MLAVALTGAALVLPTGSEAQAPRELDLGDGVSVRQVSVPCGLGRCLRWRPRGLRFTGHEQRLAYARTFARVPTTGRIVAAYSESQPSLTLDVVGRPVGNAGMLYTDDGGRTWQRSRWPWPHAANAIAFDRETPFGVAVGDAGYVWSTEDGGRTWSDRRSDAGVVYTQVAVLERIVVYADSGGQVWRSTDGGFQRRSLVEQRDVELTTTHEAILVKSPTGETLMRVLENGTIVRP